MGSTPFSVQGFFSQRQQLESGNKHNVEDPLLVHIFRYVSSSSFAGGAGIQSHNELLRNGVVF